MDEARIKAWESLQRYKFQMFGYWAAIWVHLNRVGGFREPNPFRDLVIHARNMDRLPTAPPGAKDRPRRAGGR